MATEFKIQGVVREKESGQPLGGVSVRAYDRDLHFDDLLGEAGTAVRAAPQERCRAPRSLT